MIWTILIGALVFGLVFEQHLRIKALQNDARRATELAAQGDQVRYNRIETVGHDLAALTIRVSRLCAFTGKLERVIAEQAQVMLDFNRRFVTLDRRFIQLRDCVNDLTPAGVLAVLEKKEAWLDTANERVDNGIGTARAAGEAAGENAARNLIRECVERAAQGKGPPLQVLPEHFVGSHIAKKIQEGGV